MRREDLERCMKDNNIELNDMIVVYLYSSHYEVMLLNKIENDSIKGIDISSNPISYKVGFIRQILKARPLDFIRANRRKNRYSESKV